MLFSIFFIVFFNIPCMFYITRDNNRATTSLQTRIDSPSIYPSITGQNTLYKSPKNEQMLSLTSRLLSLIQVCRLIKSPMSCCLCEKPHPPVCCCCSHPANRESKREQFGAATDLRTNYFIWTHPVSPALEVMVQICWGTHAIKLKLLKKELSQSNDSANLKIIADN